MAEGRRELPARVAEALAGYTRMIPAGKIVGLMKHDPSFCPGMRPIPANAGFATEKILSFAARPSELPELFRLAIFCHHPLAGLIGALSEDFLREQFSELATVLGEARLVSAMVVGFSEKNRETAGEHLEANPERDPFENEDRVVAARSLAGVFSPLFESLEAVSGPGEAEEKGRPGGGPDEKREKELLKKIGVLEKRLASRERQGKEKTREMLSRQRQAEKTLKQEAAEWKRRALESSGAAKAALEKAESAERRMVEEVERKVGERMGELSRSWLVVPESTRREAERVARETAVSGGTVAKARLVLEQQAKADRHFGNRTRLARDLEEKERLLGEIEEAARESLHPLPELAPVAGELREEVARLRRLLAPGPAPSGLAGRFIAALNSARTFEQFQEVALECDRLIRSGILPRGEMGSFYRKYYREIDRFYDLPRPPEVEDPVRRLKQAVEENREFIIMIDGHNAMFLLPEVFEATWKADGSPGRESIRKLVSLTGKLLEKRPGLGARVFFDSDAFEAREPSENLVVVFSGGTGRHRADGLILEEIGRIRAGGGPPACLVTDDRDLSEKSMSLGVPALRPEALVLIWEHFGLL